MLFEHRSRTRSELDNFQSDFPSGFLYRAISFLALKAQANHSILAEHEKEHTKYNTFRTGEERGSHHGCKKKK